MTQCPFPVLRRISSKDLMKKSEYVQTPCGICEVCRKNFAHEWGTRVYHESLLYDKCCFVTLTYAPEKMPLGCYGVPTIQIEDVQNFMKRWREYIQPEKIRYFCGCEYSPLNHLPHYHIAVFGADLWDNRIFSAHVPRDCGYSVECRFWDKGYVHVGNLEVGSACYVAGYALKKVMGSANKDYYKNLGIIPPRALMSRNPGIGAVFCDNNASAMMRLQSTTVDSWITCLPRYYQNRLDIKNSDEYQERIQKANERLLSEAAKMQTVYDLQDKIINHFNKQEFYRDRELYHNRLVERSKL